MMQVLADALWAKFEAAIAAVKPRGARPRKGDRRTIEAITWRLDNGAEWRSIPAGPGVWRHAHLRPRRCAVAGVWDRVMAPVVAEGGPQLAFACIDGTVARAPGGGRSASEQTAALSLRLDRNTDGDPQALGRSRGGFSSKIVGLRDAAGRLVEFVLVAGQAHELAASPPPKRLPKAPAWALADMACDAVAFRSAARATGAIPVVPSRKDAKQPRPCPGCTCRHRNLVERCWPRLKEPRAIATRHDRTAMSCAAGVAVAATPDWFKSSR